MYQYKYPCICYKKEEPLFSGNRTTRRRRERGESVNQEKSGSLKKEGKKEEEVSEKRESRQEIHVKPLWALTPDALFYTFLLLGSQVLPLGGRVSNEGRVTSRKLYWEE